MISVIVPVYNVEPYLEKCLDSIIGQTYKDLEILVIDDGSTDRSGEICDNYAQKDKRIKVFHTENQGLSTARNLGLDHAKGEYIGFVDSDDWIEPDMYACLLKNAEQTSADIAECGVFLEYQNKTEERKKQKAELTGEKAVQALLLGKLNEGVWNKLWKRQCFDTIRFPQGRVFEDVATTYIVFSSADHVIAIPESKYHYLKRKDSLSEKHCIYNLIGYWLSHKERFDALYNQVDENGKQILLQRCAVAAVRTWSYYNDCIADDREAYNDVICEMNAFVRQYFLLFGDKEWNLLLRAGIFFPHFYNVLSFRTAWMINHIRKGITSSGLINKKACKY